MATDLSIRCSCSAFGGIARGVSRSAGYRAVCYCDDCQRFASYLGRVSDVLDVHGGTDIFQTSPARIEITRGADRMSCVRLTPKGPLRWYADCCRTPIGNTLATNQVPFVGLISACMDPQGRALDEVIGPVRIRIMCRFAEGAPDAPNCHAGFSLSHVLRIGASILSWRLRGDHRRGPFFDPTTGRAVATVNQSY